MYPAGVFLCAPGGSGYYCAAISNIHFMKHLLLLFLVCSSFSLQAQFQDTVLIDFGGINNSPWPWNNLNNQFIGQSSALWNSYGLPTDIGIMVVDSFNGVNGSGTQMPGSALGIPSTASGDSFFGNTELFAGQIQPSGAVQLTGLDPEKVYTVVLFASRLASDNRQTRYTVKGMSNAILDLQVADNEDVVTGAFVFPAPDSTITIEAMPGPENNNSFGFFYLGALKLIYESDTPPPSATLDLQVPDGGEYWQTGKPVRIHWKSNLIQEVILDYSTNGGQDWLTIDTVSAFPNSYTWNVPDMPSTECLVRISSDTLMDESIGYFEITDDTTSCRIVVLGSSTAAGAGPSHPDSTWVGRYRNGLYGRDTRYEVVNLAQGGTTTFHIIPAGSPIPMDVNVTPNPDRNVTKALSLDPYAIIVNMPSNDAANLFSTAYQMNNFELIAEAADSMGVETWICTTQPRNFNDSVRIQIQLDTRDSILAVYGDYAIDFWTGFPDSMNQVDPQFDSGDGVHLNDAGHRLLHSRVVEKMIDTLCVVPDVVSVNDNHESAPSIEVYPNPFQDRINIKVFLESKADYHLQLFDLQGILRAEKSGSLPNGNQLLEWQLPGFTINSPSALILKVNLKTEGGNSTQVVKLFR